MLLKMLTIASKLRSLLDSSGMTAYRLAKNSGVPSSNLSDFLNGKKMPTDDVLSKLAPVLGVEFDELRAYADFERIGGEAGLARIQRYLERERSNGPVRSST